MVEIERAENAAEIQLYERGIGVGPAVKGVLGRFLPASVTSLGVVLFGLVGAPWVGLAGLGAVVLEFSGAMTVGYWLGLEAMRRWLFPDAEIDGRRSVVAGLMSSLVVFILTAAGVPVETTGAPWILGLVGAVLAVVMFFAWLTPTPEGVAAEWDVEEEASLIGSESDAAVRDVL